VTDTEKLGLLEETARRLKRQYKRRAPKKPDSSDDPLDGLIGTILSHQNADATTARMFDGLKAAFPTWRQALEAGPDEIQRVLEASRGGLSRVKAGYIHRVLIALMESYGALSLEFLREMPDVDIRTFLQALPGVGMKTSSCVLMFDLGRAAMPVDTHIHRLARRMGFVEDKTDAVKTELWFDARLPKDWKKRWEFHVNAIDHGKRTCHAQRPACEACVLCDLCPSAKA
jgi:endonuclease III